MSNLVEVCCAISVYGHVAFAAFADEIFPELQGVFDFDSAAEGDGEISVVFPVADGLS